MYQEPIHKNRLYPDSECLPTNWCFLHASGQCCPLFINFCLSLSSYERQRKQVIFWHLLTAMLYNL